MTDSETPQASEAMKAGEKLSATAPPAKDGEPMPLCLECCFACGKAITRFPPAIVDTRDDQTVYVGPDCFQKVKRAGTEGYQPPRGGPRLWLLPPLKRQPLVSVESGICDTRDPYDSAPVEGAK